MPHVQVIISEFTCEWGRKGKQLGAQRAYCIHRFMSQLSSLFVYPTQLICTNYLPTRSCNK